jgi:hypothetical protein
MLAVSRSGDAQEYFFSCFNQCLASTCARLMWRDQFGTLTAFCSSEDYPAMPRPIFVQEETEKRIHSPARLRRNLKVQHCRALQGKKPPEALDSARDRAFDCKSLPRIAGIKFDFYPCNPQLFSSLADC